MFRVYKPKNVVRVKAIQVTLQNVSEAAVNLMGRVVTADVEGKPVPVGVDVPTFEGVKSFAIGQWIIRDDQNNLTPMSNEDFEKAYEVARNTAGG